MKLFFRFIRRYALSAIAFALFAAIFAAGAQYPDQPVIALAITARNTKGELIDEPASPCGPCRQVLIETETRFKHPVRILLYGRKRTFVINSIKELMPLSFTEF